MPHMITTDTRSRRASLAAIVLAIAMSLAGCRSSTPSGSSHSASTPPPTKTVAWSDIVAHAKDVPTLHRYCETLLGGDASVGKHIGGIFSVTTFWKAGHTPPAFGTPSFYCDYHTASSVNLTVEFDALPPGSSTTASTGSSSCAVEPFDNGPCASPIRGEQVRLTSPKQQSLPSMKGALKTWLSAALRRITGMTPN